MILIADSGSTKTHWCLLDGKNAQHFYTQGFNPYVQTEEYITRAVEKELLPNFSQHHTFSISHVYYYGAGCSSRENVGMVQRALKKNIPDSKIEVEHDLLAA